MFTSIVALVALLVCFRNVGTLHPPAVPAGRGRPPNTRLPDFGSSSNADKKLQLVDGFSHCLRKCDGTPKDCYFRLHVERYPVLGGACRNCTNGNQADCLRSQCITANGFFRAMVAVNRQLPAPALQVCKGDRIIADVENAMPDATTTIHWHGIRQRGSQYYDGVPYVTQCPIAPGSTFRYKFVAEESGTFFYHSHTGVQKFDGLSGPLIVRDVNDSQGDLYDQDLPEHVMFIGDWSNIPGEQYLPGFNNRDISQLPDSFLINGRAPFWGTDHSVSLPLAEFLVQKGVRYRFRLIGGICMICPVAVKFQGHRVTAISADGNLKFTPKAVDTVVLSSADRFDVILEANQTEGTYFIFVDNVQQNCKGNRGIAILRYSKSNSEIILPAPTAGPIGVVLNPINVTCEFMNTKEICVSQLQGEHDAPAIRNEFYTFLFLDFNFYNYDDNDLFAPGTYQPYDEPVQNRRVKGMVNNITFTFPPSPMISQFDDIPGTSFCAPECYTSTIKKSCSCTNYYNLPFNNVVNVIVYDLGGKDSVFSHPYHLHGYNFYVLEMGKFPSKDHHERKKFLAQLMDRLNNDEVDHRARPQRDTINIPPEGYVLTRFISDNPGYWILHCHFAFHLESGMAAVFRVGNQQMLPPIPPNFPRCGNFF